MLLKSRKLDLATKKRTLIGVTSHRCRKAAFSFGANAKLHCYLFVTAGHDLVCSPWPY